MMARGKGMGMGLGGGGQRGRENGNICNTIVPTIKTKFKNCNRVFLNYFSKQIDLSFNTNKYQLLSCFRNHKQYIYIYNILFIGK